jgi:hypothetical protein
MYLGFMRPEVPYLACTQKSSCFKNQINFLARNRKKGKVAVVQFGEKSDIGI